MIIKALDIIIFREVQSGAPPPQVRCILHKERKKVLVSIYHISGKKVLTETSKTPSQEADLIIGDIHFPAKIRTNKRCLVSRKEIA